jgi:hypothetical protein
MRGYEHYFQPMMLADREENLSEIFPDLEHTRQALFRICMIIRIIKAVIDSIVSLCYLCGYETIVDGICSRMLTGLCEYDIE